LGAAILIRLADWLQAQDIPSVLLENLLCDVIANTPDLETLAFHDLLEFRDRDPP